MTEEQGTRHLRPVSDRLEPAASQPYYGQSWAVVIGIDDYGGRHPRLANARNDAEAIVHILQDSYGFDPDQVITLYDDEATRNAIMTWLLDELPARVDADDRVMFFFAGHGTTRESAHGEKRGYLIPHDARKDRYADYVDMRELRDACGLIPAKHVFIILDCCFAGVAAVTSRGKPKTRQTIDDVYLKKITERPAWQILTAGASDELAADSGVRPGHSAFTGALLEGLEGQADQNKDNLITAIELAAYVSPRVTRETAVEGAEGQRPFFNYLSGSGQGDFVFLLPGQEPKIQPAGVVRKQVQPVLHQHPWLWAVGVLALTAIVVLSWVALSSWQRAARVTRAAEETATAVAADAQQIVQALQVTLTANAQALRGAEAEATQAATGIPGPTQTAAALALANQQATATVAAMAVQARLTAIPTAVAATLTAQAQAAVTSPEMTSTSTPTSFWCRVTEQIGAVNVRSGPGVSFSVRGLLQPGDTVSVLVWDVPSDQSDIPWFQVKIPDGSVGWIISQPYPDLGRELDCNFDPTQSFTFPRASTATPTASTSAPPFPADASIAFVSTRAGGSHIFLVKAEGEPQLQPVQITQTTGEVATFGRQAYSCRRQQFIFHTKVGGNFDVFRMDRSGGGLLNLTKDQGWDQMRGSWSPDGIRITFLSTIDGKNRIWVMNADGASKQPLTAGLDYKDEQPAWSPDGQWIAFSSQASGQTWWEIFKVRADGQDKDRQQLTRTGGVNRNPAWSPDGRRLAFACGEQEAEDICLIDADGSNMIRLRTSEDEGRPVWSPDGHWIAFDRYVDDRYLTEIFVFDPISLEEHRVTSSEADEWGPEWVPDQDECPGTTG